MRYLINGIEYLFDYSHVKSLYERYSTCTDDEFMDNLPNIAHLACFVCYLKGFGNDSTISDKGIIHELIHLMTEPKEPTNKLQEVRQSFNEKIKLS